MSCCCHKCHCKPCCCKEHHKGPDKTNLLLLGLLALLLLGNFNGHDNDNGNRNVNIINVNNDESGLEADDYYD